MSISYPQDANTQTQLQSPRHPRAFKASKSLVMDVGCTANQFKLPIALPDAIHQRTVFLRTLALRSQLWKGVKAMANLRYPKFNTHMILLCYGFLIAYGKKNNTD